MVGRRVSNVQDGGRGRELAAVARALADPSPAATRLVLLAGEAGIGKTWLAGRLAERAEREGALVLGTACWPGSGAPPLWPWAQVLRGCLRAVGPAAVRAYAAAGVADLVRIVPEAASALGVPAPEAAQPAQGPPDQQRFRMFESVATLLGNLSARRPLHVVLDDLHWADDSSLLMLRFLAGDLRGRRVALVAAYRHPDRDPGSSLDRALPDLVPVATSLMLSGLDRAAVAPLVAAGLGADPGPDVIGWVHDRTGGNPLFVREIAALLRARGPGGPDGHSTRPIPVVPHTVQAVVAQRLGYLEDRCLRMLAAAAVRGAEVDPAVLVRVTGGGLSSLLELCEQARAAGLVEPVPDSSGWFRFTHALVRDVLYERLPVARRQALHRLTAQAIEDQHRADLEPHLGELAHQWLLAGEEGPPGRALDYAVRAGRRALQALAYEEAAAHFAQALRLLDGSGADAGERQRGELLLDLGDARLRAGDWPAAVDAYGQAAESARRRGDATGLARTALGLGSGLGGFEVRLFDRAQVDLLREALQALGSADSPLRAWVLARLSVALSLDADDSERRRLAGEAIEVARRVGEPTPLAYALAAHCDVMAGPDLLERRRAESHEIIQLAGRAGDAELELLGRRLLIVASLEAGDLAATDAQIAAYASTAARLRQPLYLWFVPLWQAMRALMAGRQEEAAALSRRAGEVGARGHSRNAEVLVRAQELSLLLDSGRAAEACASCERHFPPAQFPATPGWLAGLLAVAGRNVEATAWLDRLVGAGFAGIPKDSEWLASLVMAARGCVIVRHGEAARLLYRLLTPYGDRFAVDGIAAACLGSVSAVLGSLAALLDAPAEADEHFQRALAAHRRAGATLLVAHTLREWGQASPAGGERARRHLEEALRIYRDLGLRGWAAGCERLLAARPAGSLPAVAAAATESAAESEAGGLPAQGHVFRREGDAWVLSFAGLSVRCRDLRGMQDLALLLANPGREVHVLDLVAGVRTPEVAAAGYDAGEVLDEQARTSYRRRLADLESEIEDAEAAGDAGREQRARDEREALVGALAAAYGLGGRARRLADPAERARSTVTQRIRASLDRIARLHPALGAHLRNSVRTGTFCSYQPERPTTWEL